MLLDTRTPRNARQRIRVLGKAQEMALKILAQTPRYQPPRPGSVTARGLVRRHTFESLAGSGLARLRRLPDNRLLFDLTPEGKKVAQALGLRVHSERGRPRGSGRHAH